MLKTLELDVAISADTQVLVSYPPCMSGIICSASNGTPVNTVAVENLLFKPCSAFPNIRIGYFKDRNSKQSCFFCAKCYFYAKQNFAAFSLIDKG